MKAIKSIKENGVEKYANESVKNLFASESFTTKQEQIDKVREMIVKTSQQSLCNTLLAISMRSETCSQLQAINIPVLIMVGKEDTVTPPASSKLMYEKIQDSFLNIIEHAGHLSNLENPYEFNYHLKKFAHQFAKGALPVSDAVCN